MNELSRTALLVAARAAFLHGLGASAFALSIARLYFPMVFEMAASALVALSLYPRMEEYLDYNRRAIWESQLCPWRINIKLALEFLFLFTAVLLVSVVHNLAFDAASANPSLSSVFRNDFFPLLLHNSTVLVVTFFFAVLYRAGGLVVILSWNALHWSRSLFGYFDFMRDTVGVVSGLLVMSSIVPHLIVEVVAYVLAGMAGTFLGKGVSQYRLSSEKFKQVVKACGILLLLAGALLILANILEIFLAQRVWRYLRP